MCSIFQRVLTRWKIFRSSLTAMFVNLPLVGVFTDHFMFVLLIANIYNKKSKVIP